MKTVDVPVEGKVFFQDKISVVEVGTIFNLLAPQGGGCLDHCCTTLGVTGGQS